MKNRYTVEDKRLKVMTEEQKQRVVSTWIKLTRYKAWTEQFPECFGQTEQICLKDLEKENRSNDIKPGSRDCVTFWSGIWVELVSQNNKTEQWLKKELVSDTSKKPKKKQENTTIPTENLKTTTTTTTTTATKDRIDYKGTG